jgi:hypothetical protein
LASINLEVTVQVQLVRAHLGSGTFVKYSAPTSTGRATDSELAEVLLATLLARVCAQTSAWRS